MPKESILEIKKAGQRIWLRWYVGFSYKGDCQKIIDFLESLVRKKNIYDDLPHIFIDCSQCSDPAKYLFLPIESQRIGRISEKIQVNVINPLLKKRSLINDRIDRAFSDKDEVAAWVGSPVEVYEFIPYSIPYRPKAKIRDRRSPFEFDSEPYKEQIINTADIERKSKKYDRLLYWLSGLGSGTWQSFKKACDALQIEEPKRILRRLKILGHLESSSDGKRWSIAPTALVKVASDSNKSEYEEYILCGQRSIALLERLKKYARLTFIPQPGGDAPHCIRLKISDISDSNKPGFCVNSWLKSSTSARKPVSYCSDFTVVNAENASLKLAELLPDLKNWQKQLTTLPGIVPSLYQWQQFNCQTNQFEECDRPTKTGLYVLSKEAKQNYSRTLFYERERDAFMQGDWYGLRFLSCQHSGQECRGNHDNDSNRLAIRWQQRWPEIYERSLVLASGLLPTARKPWLFYENAGVELMLILSDKLNIIC